jgi:peptidoglycan/xylan/chitin deacetylase (PgdA/CDA1 family)
MNPLVLCYHAVSDDWPAELSVTPERLTAQLELLSRRGYRGATFSEVVRGEAPRRSVALTFDDGYASTLELARPILDRFEMPGTLFVPTTYIGGGPMSWPGIDGWLGTEHQSELVPLDWDGVRELADAGWEIGSHTKSHPHLTQTPDPQLDDELRESREICEQELGRPCESIAYPFGDHDDRVIAATAAAGYRAAATFPSALTVPAALAWPRIGVFQQDDQRVFKVKVSPTVIRLRHTGAWRLIGPALRKVGRRPRA